MHNPNPDPGEEYPMSTRNCMEPCCPNRTATNKFAKWRLPLICRTRRACAPMAGFVTDYINNFN